jgi:chromosomal replication initiation ATPase DnaA
MELGEFQKQIISRKNKMKKNIRLEESYIDIPEMTYQEETQGHVKMESCQWSIFPNDEFAPAMPTSKKLEAGLYECKWNNSIQSPSLVKKQINLDELYELPSPEIQSILDDIQTFWDRKIEYRKYNFVHKRGILLWGDPGCGKSGIIQLCVKRLIEVENGIVINICDEDQFAWYTDIIKELRKIEPERPLIVILEDVDSLAGEDRYSTTKLLNILDGVNQIDNVVYIATTNYPEKLQERITNRPSRFDRRYQVEMPSREIREAYISKKLTKEDLKRIDLKVWLDKTEGMSLSHLKELVVSVVVMGKTFEDSLSNLEEMKANPKPKKKSKGIGFGKSAGKSVEQSS